MCNVVHIIGRGAGLSWPAKPTVGPTQPREYCRIEYAARPLLPGVMRQMQLSARVYHRILKLARMIADLCGEERIGDPQIAEAIQYRPRRQWRSQGAAVLRAGGGSDLSNGGQIVSVPADTLRKFVNSGPGVARHVDIHTGTRTHTAWLEQE